MGHAVDRRRRGPRDDDRRRAGRRDLPVSVRLAHVLLGYRRLLELLDRDLQGR